MGIYWSQPELPMYAVSLCSNIMIRVSASLNLTDCEVTVADSLAAFWDRPSIASRIVECIRFVAFATSSTLERTAARRISRSVNAETGIGFIVLDLGRSWLVNTG